MSTPFIPLILATARIERQSIKPAEFVFAEMKDRKDLETEFIDVGDFLFGKTVPSWEENELANKWRNIAKKADGFIIVSPEYNHSFPGELKILLDSAYEEYKGKPIAICSVSKGGFGGVRMIEQLWNVCIELGAIPVSETVQFSRVENLFEDSEIADNDKKKKKKEEVKEMLDILTKMLMR